MSDAEPGAATGPPTRRPARRALTFLLALALLAGALLVALPHALGWGLRQALLKAGADTVGLVDVDVNPFTGRVALTGLTVTHRGESVLWVGHAHARLAWMPLLKRRVMIEAAAVDDARLRVVRRPDGTLAGGFPLIAGHGGAPEAGGRARWGFGVAALDVTGTEVRYEAPHQGHVARIERLALRNLATWAPDTPASLTIDGAVDGGILAVKGTLLPFALHPSGRAQVRVTSLPLSPLQPLAPVLSDLVGTLNLDQHVAFESAPEGLSVAQRGRIEVTGVAAGAGGRKVAVDRLTWDGDLALARPPGGPVAWGVDGRLAATDVGLDQRPGGRRVRLGSLGITGRLDGGAGGVTASGQAHLAGLALVRGPKDDPLARLAQAQVEGVTRADGGDVRVARATLKGLDLIPPGPEGAEVPPLLSVAAADVTGVRVTPASLDVDGVVLSGAEARLVRESDGRLADLEALIAALAPPVAAPAPAEEAAPPAPAPLRAPFAVRIGETSLGVGARLRVEDGSVVPPYDAVLDVDRAYLKDFDTGRPDAPAPVGLEATLGKYTKVALRGTIVPLANRLTMDLAGDVTQLDLPPLNPYTAPSLGYHMDAGQLDARLRLGVDDGRLDGKADLTLRGVTVSRVEDHPGGLAEELPVPLGTALDMLKDRHDTIHVKVPLKGDVTDPQLGVRGIVNKAVAKAITAGAVGSVMVALQPFGAVIAATELAGKAIALRLDPMPFPPGAADLSDQDRKYADRIARLLKDRPRLAVRLCGRAAKADRQALAAAAPAGAPPAGNALDDALLRLAGARADALKDHLVQEGGVDPARLLVCRPEVDSDPEAGPRVDLLI